MISHILNSVMIMSAMIAGLIAVKKLLKKHITASWQYRLDYLFFVVLLLPIVPYSKTAEQINVAADVISEGSAAVQAVWRNNIFKDYTVNSTADINIFVLIWAAGTAVFIITSVLCLRKLLSYARGAEYAGDKIYGIFRDCMAETGVDSRINVKVGKTSSPMVFGLFNTVIILPYINLEEKELKNVIMHELIHYRRGDVAVNYIICAFQAVYWFNPIVWIAFAIMKNDMERACDEAVMELTGDSYGYGMTIIKFAQKRKFINFASDMGGSKKQIKSRVEAAAVFTKATLNQKIKSALSFVITLLLVITQIPNISVMAIEKSPEINGSGIRVEDLSEYFDGVNGSFVLYDLNNDLYTIYNEEGSRKRVSPDSTYKIFSALSALESGVITTEESTLKWDGTEYQFDEWNKNQNLSSAMENSVNWYFQYLDSKNFSNLQNIFNIMGYGNCDFSGGSNFWLESSLKISPVEQAQMLKSMYTNEYDFDENNISAVKESIKICDGFYGKTGTGMVNGREVNGWFVGFAEDGGNVYFFAANINDEDDAFGSAAADIAIEILSDRGIIDYEK